MEHIGSKSSLAGSSKGFTMMELLVVFALAAVLATLSTPAFMQWRKNLDGRKTTYGIVSTLREAKSRAISTNLEHRVEFESANRRYRVTRGNRSHNSLDWNTVVSDWVVLPPNVTMNANVGKIQMNTNGTANGGTIEIQVAAGASTYKVTVARTGRIRMPAVL